MNKIALFFIVVTWYCDGSFDSFCIVGFNRVVMRCSMLHYFSVMLSSCGFIPNIAFARFYCKVSPSCDFVRRCCLRVNPLPSCGLDSEICVCKLAEKVSPCLSIKMAKVASIS
jgi:hypothetical protein